MREANEMNEEMVGMRQEKKKQNFLRKNQLICSYKTYKCLNADDSEHKTATDNQYHCGKCYVWFDARAKTGFFGNRILWTRKSDIVHCGKTAIHSISHKDKVEFFFCEMSKKFT